VYHHFVHTTCPHFQMKAYMMFLMASCVAYRWPLNTQLVKCVLDASNPCPHSHMKRLYADGCIKLRWKCNVEGKVKCVMWNKWINGLTINHSPTSLPEQEQMWALDDKEMVSSSKVHLKDVSWWMSIKDAYKLKVLIIVKLLKEWCIFLAASRRPSQVAWKHD